MIKMVIVGAALALMTIAVLGTATAASAESNKNYGKADDYGSARFAQVNQCMVELINNHKAPDPKGITLSPQKREPGRRSMPLLHIDEPESTG